MGDCILKVSLAGNKRVKSQNRKNVHAKIIGFALDELGVFGVNLDDLVGGLKFGSEIVYDPYSMDSFQTLSGVSIDAAKAVYLGDRVKYVYGS